jgi:hypothetical protein
MEPFVVVLAFAAVASGLAVLRVIVEQRESRDAIRLVARHDRSANRALASLRRAADALNDLPAR